MDDRPLRTGAIPARNRRDRWILGGIAGAVVIAVVSFMAGRASVDAPDCMAAKRLAAETRSAFTAAAQLDSVEEKRKGREPLRQYAYVVAQNPQCFSASERDEAQSGLDALSRSGG
ncbi:hypothetical protein [Streptomyces lavendulae]|uniref:hypothetical protein n=1 Tax=Streptomyces lavendulae TaxID=1914 RepID=UPI0033E06CAB